MILSIVERVFLGEYVFREGSRYTDLTPLNFYLWGAAKSAVYRDRPQTLNELKTAITAYIRNILQADLQKVFSNKIKRVQACMNGRRSWTSLPTPFVSAQRLSERISAENVGE
jgi:hypothetical protein